LKILVLNSGSSSLKYQLLEMPSGELLCYGLLERIGLDGTRLKHTRGTGSWEFDESGVADHHYAVKLVLEKITDKEHGVLGSISDIGAVGHRTVHGGEMFASSVVIDADVVAEIRKCITLAPLHNPANLAGIEATLAILPGTPQVAVFDTAFHHSMPEHAFMYPLPYEFYEKYRLRRYGFHGTSHRYVSGKACEMLGINIAEARIITCHLGNGSSIAAIRGGRSIDTSMGFTPLEGLMMGTRSGDVDPSIHKFLMENETLSISEIDNILNKHSGLLGVSGISSDIRDVHAAAENGDRRAKLAIDMFCYRAKKYIGAYAAALGGADVIVFTGGIGEHNPYIRSAICGGLQFMGVIIDEKRNDVRGRSDIISAEESKVKVMSVLTDEELVIASDTYEIVTRGVKSL
jgi:acetate kinase